MKVSISIFVCFLFVIKIANCAMSDAQLKSVKKMIRNTCQPKNKATDEQIEAMHKGDWDQDRNGQCYMWCILNTYKFITKDNKFSWETVVDTLESQAPDSIRATATESVRNCKGAVKTTDDKCMAALEIARCIYMDNPKKYFLP